MKIKQFLTLILCLNIFAAKGDSLDGYYERLKTGERKVDNYSGPKDNRAFFSEALGKTIFLEDDYKTNVFNREIQSELFSLESFWKEKVLEKSTCPDEELGTHQDYIRYLYRLVSISYLFESIKLNHRISSELSFGKNACSLNYQELFGKCTAKSDDMKKFKDRIFGKFANEYEKLKYSALSKKETESFMELFHLSTINNNDPTFARIHYWCLENNVDCKKINLNDIKNAIGHFCQKDRDLMLNICNEDDEILGMSQVKILEDLVKTSNAFNLINGKGMGEDCLRRFSKLGAVKEANYKELNVVIPLIYKYLASEKVSYLQGSLFLPGALKEFDMKGLSDFLIALKPPKVVVAKKIVKVKPKPVVKPVVVAAKVPTPEPKIEPVVEVVPEVVMPKISEFEKAAALILENKSAREVLNMDLFREDFEFTSKMISSLSQPIKKFQTRKALTDMRDFDKFGTSEAPVGIIFLKFLIDTDNHQGLYNVVNVLGEKFYLMNDFEGKSTPIFAELKNDQSTNNRWQITLLKPEPVKAPIKKPED